MLSWWVARVWQIDHQPKQYPSTGCLKRIILHTCFGNWGQNGFVQYSEGHGWVMILIQLLLLDSHIFSSVFVSICLSFVAWQTKLCCFAATAASSNICKTKQSGNLRMLFMACHCYDTNVTPRNPKRMVIIRRRFVLPWWVVLLLWQQQAMATAAWHEEIPWSTGTWENAWTIYFTYVLHIMFRFLARDTEIL